MKTETLTMTEHEQEQEVIVNIKTEDQFYGWTAIDEDTYTGPDDPIGVAPYPGTEQDAIDDLCEKLDLPYSFDAQTKERRPLAC